MTTEAQQSLPNQHEDLEQDLLVMVSHWVAMGIYLCPYFPGNGQEWKWENHDFRQRGFV